MEIGKFYFKQIVLGEQFFNSPNLLFDATSASTPVKHCGRTSPGLLVTPTPPPRVPEDPSVMSTPPRARKPAVNAPRTPTPFKNALAEIEKSRLHPYTVSKYY